MKSLRLLIPITALSVALCGCGATQEPSVVETTNVPEVSGMSGSEEEFDTNDVSSDIAGTWKCVSIVSHGESSGSDAELGKETRLVLLADGTGTMITGNAKATATWTRGDDMSRLKCVSEDNLTIEGTAVIDADGMLKWRLDGDDERTFTKWERVKDDEPAVVETEIPVDKVDDVKEKLEESDVEIVPVNVDTVEHVDV